MEDIFQVLLMLILFIWALLSMQRCSAMKLNYETSQNNIVALTDSIEYYESKTGELVAHRKFFLTIQRTTSQNENIP